MTLPLQRIRTTIFCCCLLMQWLQFVQFFAFLTFSLAYMGTGCVFH
jgi:hypothetical protein